MKETKHFLNVTVLFSMFQFDSVWLCLVLFDSVCLSVCLSVWLSVTVCECLTLYCLTISPPSDTHRLFPSHSVHFHLFMSKSASISLILSIPIYSCLFMSIPVCSCPFLSIPVYSCIFPFIPDVDSCIFPSILVFFRLYLPILFILDIPSNS